MRVADLMTTDVATCTPNDSLNRAAQIMWDRRCGSVPVVDGSGTVVGIVTDRDLCMAGYTQGRRLEDIAVATVMSHPVTTCPPIATAEEAAGLMMAHGIRRLPVVEPPGRLLGILSLDDIARHAAAWDSKGDIDLERVAVALGEIARHTSAIDGGVPPELGTDLGEIIRNSRDALQTLRREIGADLKLAGEEVQKRWTRLEARLQAAELRVQQKGHDGARHLAELVEHAHEFRSRLAKTSRRGSDRGQPA